MPRILIVDDDPIDREQAGRCLASIEGMEARHAKDGREALERIAADPPDLILTDLRMPHVDGLELVKRLRGDDASPPVVLMTSKGSERTAVLALHAGAANYVPKSVMKTDLADAVQRVLDITEARKTRKLALKYLAGREVRFELVNDPALISPLSAWFQDGLAHLGFANESVRAQIGIAILEAVSNAMVHGNLELSSGLRRDDRETFDRLVAERQTEMPYAGRRVRCRARESAASLEYTIEDDGPGFDPSSLPDPTSPENLLGVAGRGIYLIRTFMDEVRFNEAGNRITMTKAALGPEKEEPSRS